MFSNALGISLALMAEIFGGTGATLFRTSADPEREVCERLPCFATSKSAEAMIDAVVETLNVECESPPVPTISH